MELLTVTTNSNSNSHVRELRCFTADTTNAKTIIITPAMGISAKKYDQLASNLSSLGFNAVVTELRGNGSSNLRASRAVDFGYADHSADLIDSITATADMFQTNSLFLFGHSLGGQISALALSLLKKNNTPIEVEGIVLAASCSVYYKGWPKSRQLGLLVFSQLSALIARAVGYYPGHKLGFGGREGKSTMIDWAYNARVGEYKLTGSTTDYQIALKKVSSPILAINFSDDTFAPKSATGNLINMMASKKIERTELSNIDISARKADHFSWLKHSKAVAAITASWAS